MKATFHYTRLQSILISFKVQRFHLTVNTMSLLQIQLELGYVSCAQCGVSVRCESAHCARRYVSLCTCCLHLSRLHCHFLNIFYLIATFSAEIFKTLNRDLVGLFVVQQQQQCVCRHSKQLTAYPNLLRVPQLPPPHYQTVQCTVHKSRDNQLLDGGA